MDLEALKARVAALLDRATSNIDNSRALAPELLQGALTVMEAFYGRESHQVAVLRQLGSEGIKDKTPRSITDLVFAVRGCLENLKAELDAGLAGSLQRRLQGEVLTDFIQLARAVLGESTEQSKNVAAVLAAAAFEDTIRRMGATLAGVIGRDDLQDVITALKDKGALVSPQLGIAQSYLNFRNKALHAEWDKIDVAGTQSLLAFVEQLLLKHFT